MENGFFVMPNRLN